MTTSLFRTIFSHSHAVLPVVHVTSTSQAIRNATLARDVGADGVFLISHGDLDAKELLETCAEVDSRLPDWWVGVNLLDIESPAEVFRQISPSIRGVWVDDAEIVDGPVQKKAVETLAVKREIGHMKCLYFGGVAFKYKGNVLAPEERAKAAVELVDVVTTSGPGTGKAASVEKIRKMKAAIGDAPLAIASGITPDNVGDYLPHADCFLVATGISRAFDVLDPHLTRELVRRVRTWAPER